MKELVHPATVAQVGVLRAMGLRSRMLTLPVLVAMVLVMIWRQVGSVCELARLVHREVLLWVPKFKITQQAINTRLRVMPAEVFGQVLEDILPVLRSRWEARKRPLPEALAWAQKQYQQVLICDGSVLDALIRKVGLLKDQETNPLAGKMTAILDGLSRLPIWIGYSPDATAHDQRFWPEIMAKVQAGALLIFDLGFTNFERFAAMTRAQITFITRAKNNLGYEVARTIMLSAAVHDRLVWIGEGAQATHQQIRLIEVLYRGKWYRYLSNELDPERLPAEILVGIYRQRWGIEDAFNIVKSLLGLSYFYSGAENAICLQLWATWILYAVLVDLTDAVAEALAKPYADISMEMVFRTLNYYVWAHHRGETNDVVDFLTSEHKLFGLVKRKRPQKYVEALTDDAIP